MKPETWNPVVSAFGDEIADDLDAQLQVLDGLGIRHLELRAAWGKNVLDLDDDELATVRSTCAAHNIGMSCIASPIGKSPLGRPLDFELKRLDRAFAVGDALGVRRIRIFAFYPPIARDADTHIEQATDRLARLTDVAAREGVVLLLENDTGLIADTPARCHAILSAIDNEALRFTWDPANFVLSGVARPTETGWPLLAPYIAHVHIKDALQVERRVLPAGEGESQVRELLLSLQDIGYQGFLALEPHLAVAGQHGGFSGPTGMRQAYTALRALLHSIDCN